MTVKSNEKKEGKSTQREQGRIDKHLNEEGMNE